MSRETEDAADDADFDVCLDRVRRHAAGEVEGVFGPQSVSWTMVREPAMLLGGYAAVLLQMAHPAIASGVASHSNFIEDMVGRARRTTAMLYTFVFGTTSEALAASARLHRVHRHVRGTIDAPGGPLDGAPYRANEQHLLRWVASTVRVASTVSFETFVRPLTPAEKAREYGEFVTSSALSGVRPDVQPESAEAFDAWFARSLEDPVLHVGKHARSIARTLLDKPLSHSPLERLMTTAMLPPAWREAFGLPWERADARAFASLVRAVPLGKVLAPAPLRYVAAYHQAQARIARARGGRASLWGRALEAATRRWEVPGALQDAARGAG